MHALYYARVTRCALDEKNNQGRRKEWSCCGAVLSDSNISSHRRGRRRRRTIFSTLTLFNFFMQPAFVSFLLPDSV
jgi:hypothetical protein